MTRPLTDTSALAALPIGMFDSGMGGLTVLHECLVALPSEDFVYEHGHNGDPDKAPDAGYGAPDDLKLHSSATLFSLVSPPGSPFHAGVARIC